MECFTVYADEIEGRIDPHFYRSYFVEQFKELLKTKFNLVELRELCVKITDGTHYTPKYFSDGICFISVKDVRENKINFKDTKFISKEEHELLIKRCKPEPDDVLLTKVGTVGMAAVIPKNVPEFSIFVSVALLKIDKNKVNPYYISAYLNSRYTKIQINRVVKGIGVPDFHLEDIAKIKIPLLPFEIQNKIVKLMDKVYSLKKSKESEAKQLLDSINDYVLDELGIKLPELKDKMAYVINSEDVKNNRCDAYYFQPKFEEIEKAVKKGKFEVKELKESFENKLIKGLLPKEEDKNGELKVLQIKNILMNGLINISKYITSKNIFKKEHKLNFEDILIVITGATIGKVGLWNKKEYFYLGGDIVKFKVNKKCNPYFIQSYLLSQLGQYQIKREITGATNGHLSPSDVEIIKIPLPPISVQNKIADEVKQRMQKAEQLQKEAKEELEKAKLEVEKIILEG